jgi:hypothetical protein
MFGMVLHETGRPLVFEELPDPVPGPGELRVRVEACGVCRTDLHVVDGELPDPKLPIIPGHEIVGRIDALGSHVEGREIGERSAFPGLGRPAASAPIREPQGEPLRPACLHGLHAKRRLRDPRYRRRALCFPLERKQQRRRAYALALCRSHRLALAELRG